MKKEETNENEEVNEKTATAEADVDVQEEGASLRRKLLQS